jgi:hypothetical protein
VAVLGQNSVQAIGDGVGVPLVRANADVARDGSPADEIVGGTGAVVDADGAVGVGLEGSSVSGSASTTGVARV